MSQRKEEGSGEWEEHVKIPSHPKKYKNRTQQGSALSAEGKEKACMKNVVH